MNNEKAFQTLEREVSESTRAFVVRTWAKCLPDVDLNVEQEQRAIGEVVVQDGYTSPYVFGRRLRELVADPNATIFAAHRQDKPPIYYAWGMGAKIAALYDPEKRDRPVIDFFDAADKL